MMMFPMMNPNIGNGDYFSTGLQSGSALYKNFIDTLSAKLANQKAAALLPYATEREKAEIAESLSRARYAGAQAGLDEYKLANTELLKPEEVQKYNEYLKWASGANKNPSNASNIANFSGDNITKSTNDYLNYIGTHLKNYNGANESLPASTNIIKQSGVTSLLPANQIDKTVPIDKSSKDYMVNGAKMVADENNHPGLKDNPNFVSGTPDQTTASYIPSLLDAAMKQGVTFGQPGTSMDDMRQKLGKALIQGDMDKIQKNALEMKALDLKIKGAGYNNLPSLEKLRATSQMRAFGISDADAGRLLVSGVTPGDIAVEKGYDRDKPLTWPAPIAPATIGSLSRVAQINAGVAAMKPLSEFIDKYMSPFAKTLGLKDTSHGLPLDLVLKKFRGKLTDEELGHLVAANQAALELASARTKATGGIMGIGMLEESLRSSKQGLYIPGLAMTPKAMHVASTDLDKLLTRVGKAETDAIQQHMEESANVDDLNSAKESTDAYDESKEDLLKEYIARNTKNAAK